MPQGIWTTGIKRRRAEIWDRKDMKVQPSPWTGSEPTQNWAWLSSTWNEDWSHTDTCWVFKIDGEMCLFDFRYLEWSWSTHHFLPVSWPETMFSFPTWEVVGARLARQTAKIQEKPEKKMTLGQNSVTLNERLLFCGREWQHWAMGTVEANHEEGCGRRYLKI